MPKVVLGLHLPGEAIVAPGTVASLCHAVQANSGSLDFSIIAAPAGLGTARALNFLANTFLATQAAHLVLIASGITFSPDAIVRLLDREPDIVAAPYPVWDSGFEQGLVLSAGDTAQMLAGLRSVDFVPAGFMRIRRRALEAIAAKATPYEDFGRTITGFFNPMVNPGSERPYLGEDWAFCQRARDAGLAVHCDFDLEVGRAGAYAYRVQALPDGTVPIHEYTPVIDRLLALPSAALRPAEMTLPEPIGGFVEKLAELETMLKTMAIDAMAEHFARTGR
ncbi:MAG: hypothetical protein KGR26_07905 [Cyanobacteria bacterium REEB65]|nr:hypothetical protein [Cyanobacteria bacterium REEB65]